MTRTDHKIIFTALGFLAVILRDVPEDKQGMRATAIANLIEAFCMTSVPEAFTGEYSKANSATKTEQMLERYIAELRETGSARLDFDRETLLTLYETLLVQKARHEQKDLFISGHDDVIANRILQLAEERIRREEQA